MRRDELAARLRADADDGFLFPTYDDYCVGRLHGTVGSLLGVDAGPTLPDDALGDAERTPETVAVVLVDGFGYEQWERHARDHAFFRRVEDAGTVTPLTSVYPSETAAAMTTLYTGALPGEHGLLGWFGYVPERAVRVETLPCRTVDGRPIEAAGVAVADYLDAASPYPRFAAAGAQTTFVQPDGIPDTPLSAVVQAGAESRTYGGLDEFAAELRAAVGGDSRYVFAYLPHVDAASHEAGTRSRTYRRKLADLSGALSTGLDLGDGTARETLLVVAADHGHVDTDPDANRDLTTVEGFVDHLRRHDDGSPVWPAGGPRNVHLYAREGHAGALRSTVADALDCRTFSRAEALDADLWGPDPGDLLRRRIGDVLVVPRESSAWVAPEAHELDLVGMHGGLHPDEMLVPFATARLADV